MRQPGSQESSGRQRTTLNALSSRPAPLPTPDSPASDRGSDIDDEGFGEGRQTEGIAGRRLRGEDRLEALAAVLAAAEAGAGDGASPVVTRCRTPVQCKTNEPNLNTKAVLHP